MHTINNAFNEKFKEMWLHFHEKNYYNCNL